MTPQDLLYELNNFLKLLLREGIAIHTTKVIPRGGRRGFQRITWATDSAVPGSLFRQPSATIAEYREWVHYQGYSALLYDGSIVQISYEFDYRRLVGHRLLYFPCPFDFDQDLLDTAGLFEVMQVYIGGEAELVKLRTPVRFDYDSSAESERHPESHMTFQWSHCRIPVFSPLSPGHFIRFLFKNFYPTIWQDNDFIRQWPRYSVSPTISLEDSRELHFNARTEH